MAAPSWEKRAVAPRTTQDTTIFPMRFAPPESSAMEWLLILFVHPVCDIPRFSSIARISRRGCRTHNAAKAYMRRRRIYCFRESGSRTVPLAIVGSTKMRAAFYDFSRNLDVGLTG